MSPWSAYPLLLKSYLAAVVIFPWHLYFCFRRMIPLKNTYVFSIDWLQLFCQGLPPESDKMYTSPRVDSFGSHRDYYFRPAREFLHGYREHRRVCYKKYDVATISWEPSDKRVNPRACAIKLANPVLYVREWRFILEDILCVLGWQPLNITRCDLCCDFNKFAGGLLPANFMRQYLQEPTATRCSYMRIGTDKFTIYGQKDRQRVDVNTIRWGSRQNGVSTYMYNKSLELEQAKFKPYIVNLWKSAGLVYDNKKLPVWRIEFSISSKGVHLQDLELDQQHNLWLDDFDTEAKVRELFKVYAAKFFRFVKYYSYSPKAKKDLPQVELFSWDQELPLRPVSLCVNVDSGRTERLISKRLASLAEAYEDASFMSHMDFRRDADLLTKAADVFDEIANVKAWRREFDIGAEHVPHGVLTDEERAALERVHQRERLARHIQRQQEIDFISRQNMKFRKYQKINTLGGGRRLNSSPITSAGGEEVPF